MTVSTFSRRTGIGPNHFGVMAWSAIKALTGLVAGDIAIASDLAYSELVWNGSRWRPVSGVALIGQSGQAASVTGTAAETTLATLTIPGGVMGADGALRISTLWTVTNSVNNKTIRAKFGGTAFFGVALTTSLDYNDITMIRNTAANAQKAHALNGSVRIGMSGAAITTGNVDTSGDQALILTGELVNTGETIRLDGYSVELLA